MKLMGSWGKHKLNVSSKKILAFDSFSTSAEAKDKDSKSKHKKIELQEVSFSIACHSGAGANVEDEFYSWRKDIGSSHYLYMHGKKFRTNALKLTSVTLSEVKQDDRGRFLYGKIALKFKEVNKSSKSSGSRSTAGKDDKKTKKQSKVKKS